MTAAQVHALATLVNKTHMVRSLTVRVNIGNSGMRELVAALKQSSWKAIRSTDRRLYSLEVSSAGVEGDGVTFLYDLFADQFKLTPGT